MRKLGLVLFCVLSGTAHADERMVRLDDPSVTLEGAIYKNMDVTFADSFAKGSLAGKNIDKLSVSEVPPGKVCFLDGMEDPIDLDSPKMVDYARADRGDFCVSRAEVSARFTPVTAAAGAPPAPFYYLDKTACRWTWKTGKGIGLWYEVCDYGGGSADVIYDDGVDGFVFKPGSADETPVTILRQFRKPGGPDALLPELKASGAVSNTPDCQFQPVVDPAYPMAPGWTALEAGPKGKLKDAFDATPEGDMPEPPCGDLGLAVDYVGFFLVHKDHPDRILWVDLGQDVSPMDLPSITLSP